MQAIPIIMYSVISVIAVKAAYLVTFNLGEKTADKKKKRKREK